MTDSEFRAGFPRTSAVIDAGVAEGLHSGAQVYASIAGRTVLDIAIGTNENRTAENSPADNRPAEGITAGNSAITTDSIPLWLSSGKPITAVAIAILWQRGLLELDDPVARHIPEFATNGKEKITLRHLLTHTGGFRWADYHLTMPWPEIIRRICDVRPEPNWIFGKTAGYHAFTSWYILAEIIQRVDPARRSFETFITEEIFQPLGMRDCSFTMSPEKFHALGDRICVLKNTGKSHAHPLGLDSPERCMLCVPGASGRGPMRELAKFYEMLLNRGKSSTGARILSPQTVEALTARHRTGLMDLTFKQIVDWGLGVIVNSAIYGEPTVPYGFGPHASARTFGHGGSQSSVALVDPENQLVTNIVFNGMPGEAAHHKRMRATLGAMYEDLGLAATNNE